MVKEMCEEAGINGKKSNHSLRVSGASSLFSAGVPEHVIQGCTGHSSLDALRKYERVTLSQEFAVSRILSGQDDMFKPCNEVSPHSGDYKCDISQAGVL